MRPISLHSSLLQLDLPVAADADAVFNYCQDPLFERYLTIPWPYQRAHAVGFLSEIVPAGWANDREYIWALRSARGEPTGTSGFDEPAHALLGVIGLRRPQPGIGSIGFWLGAPFRGRGLMPQAHRLVTDWAFTTGVVTVVRWECVLGNVSSARLARAAGYSYTGIAPASVESRDGSHPDSWHAVLDADDNRSVKSDWPEPVVNA